MDLMLAGSMLRLLVTSDLGRLARAACQHDARRPWIAEQLVALARLLAQLFRAADRNEAATVGNRARLAQFGRRFGDRTPRSAHHVRDEFMRQWQLVRVGPVRRHQQPSGKSLL